MQTSKITQHEFDTTTRVCKHCAKDSKDATATNCFERSIEASMDLVATLVKQLQISQDEERKRQEEDRKRQEEDRKRQEEDRKRQEEDRKRQEEDRKRQEEDRKRLQTVVEGVEGLKEGVEGLKAGMLGGVFHSDILIQTEIPAEIRQRQSIHGSWVGTKTEEGKAITTFISNQVLGLIDDSWRVDLDQFASVDQEVKNFADFTKHSALYAALNVENDNQYNIKVNIQDSKKHVVHLTTRPDFLILPKAYATKDQRLDQVYLQTILFVEVISGKKTEDESLRQLLTTLRAVAAHTGKHTRLYGIVVDKSFTQARLVKCAARTPGALFSPRRDAPQTSLLCKLNCREAWQSSAVNIFALQLSVKMQRFAASLKQQPLLQLKNECLKYFQLIFRLNSEPTLAFVRDLGDVLVRWWLGRTDTHAAAVTTEQIVQRLQSSADQELVPSQCALRNNKKQNLCKVWEQDYTKVPDCGALIRGCFEPADGDFFVRWLAQKVRAWRTTGSPCAGAPQTVVGLPCGPGDEHVVVFRDANDHDSARKNAVLQQSLLVMVDGCSRQAHEGQRKELLKVLRSDRKVPGNEGGRTMPINLRYWRQVLVLPDANGEWLWTSDQLRQKGLAVALTLLSLPRPHHQNL
eukprot:g58405.t1